MKKGDFFFRTATVYHRWSAEEGERWQGAVLKGVCWQETAGCRIGTASASNSRPMEKVTVYIPADADSGGKVFCPPEEFDALEDKTGAWTVCPGDVIGKGAGPLEAGGSPLRALDGKGGGYAVVTVTFHDAPGELTHWEVKAQ